jgi:hypothetical protein
MLQTVLAIQIAPLSEEIAQIRRGARKTVNLPVSIFHFPLAAPDFFLDSDKAKNLASIDRIRPSGRSSFASCLTLTLDPLLLSAIEAAPHPSSFTPFHKIFTLLQRHLSPSRISFATVNGFSKEVSMNRFFTNGAAKRLSWFVQRSSPLLFRAARGISEFPVSAEPSAPKAARVATELQRSTVTAKALALWVLTKPV